MPDIIPMVGRKFNRLLVVSYAHQGKKNKQAYWNCLCDCGNTTIGPGYEIRIGTKASCGCLAIESTRTRSITHGYAIRGGPGYTTYRAWMKMLERSTSKTYIFAKNYSERGIGCCKRWLKFENFLKDMGDHPGIGFSLDRIDNNKGYSPKNCRWATHVQQSNNRRSNRLIKINGKTQTLAQWCCQYKIKHHTVAARIKRGWDPLIALTKPLGKNWESRTK